MSPPRHIHDAAAFRSILDLERSRSDRSGNPFALVLFSLSGTDRLGEFLSGVRDSIRSTDHVGLMGDSAAVILWNTNGVGALQFVQKISPLTRRHESRQDVFVYPEPAAPMSTQFGSKSALLKTQAANSDSVGTQSATLHQISEPPQSSVEAEDSSARIESTLQLTEEMVNSLIEGGASSVELRSLAPFFARPLSRWKRWLDVVGAITGLIVLSPILLFVAAAIKLSSPGPVLFCQRRSGLGGRPFLMYKFRSMVVDAEDRKADLLKENEQDGPAFKMEHDPRITRIGHMIRKTSIDELPQLWNVLRGDMSIVGPRPLPCDETEACEPWQKRRLEVTPGLTCIWQVQDRRTKIPFDEWARMDIRYSESQSPHADASLVIRTLRSIFGRKGV